MSLFDKPVDFRFQSKSSSLDKAVLSISCGSDSKKHPIKFLLGLIVVFLLSPIWLFWKLLEYIHLVTLMVFGGLFIYFGLTDVFKNSWTDSVIILSIGIGLLIAPIFFIRDKAK